MDVRVAIVCNKMDVRVVIYQVKYFNFFVGKKHRKKLGAQGKHRELCS